MKQCFFALLLSLSFCSCTTLYYPDRICVAGLSEKGEWKASAGAKVQANTALASAYVDAVHAFADNFFWMASYRNIHNATPLDPLSGSGPSPMNGHRGDLGLGGWFPVDPEWQLEWAGGYGMGTLSRRTFYGNANDLNLNYHRIFMQIATTETAGKISFSTGARFSYQFAYNNETRPLPGAAANLTTRSIDPFADFEVGGQVRFSTQAGFSFCSVSSEGSNIKPYLTLGLSFHHSSQRKKTIKTISPGYL